jgi:Acyl-protein synthetase, LuxE
MIPVQESIQGVIDDLFAAPPFGMGNSEKRALYADALSELTRHHSAHCTEYRRMLDLLGYHPVPQRSLEEIPFIPVRMFKQYKLTSVDDCQISRTMTSSGTTGQAVSRIYLDKTNAVNQTKALVRIMSSVLGTKRLPLLVVDSPAVLRNHELFSARGAGILGFAMLGFDLCYALDEQYQIDFARLDAFLRKHAQSKVLVFGFTFMIWQYFCQALLDSGRALQLNGILLHGGGWKHLQSHAVDRTTFRQRVAEVTGISRVCNYYGMIEQTGSVFVECEEGALHASVFSDVIVRDPVTFSVLPPQEIGLIQLVSLLPTSYPGHSILSEDLGAIIATDGCPCGRRGTTFRVDGRVKNAEVRGCSDTHAAEA